MFIPLVLGVVDCHSRGANVTAATRKLGIFSLVFSCCGCFPVPAMAGTQESAALFDNSGALLRSPDRIVAREGSHSGRMEPWNLWTQVDDGSSPQAEGPDLAFGEGNALHCTHTATIGSTAFQRLMFATSLDQNQSWVAPSVEALHTGGNIWVWEPVFAKLGGSQVWIVYRVDRPGTAGSGIGFVKSADGGSSFGAPASVDDGGPYGEQDFTPDAISSGDPICVA